jgi:hypothetical protein
MKQLLYISLSIALFLTHTPLLFTVSPGPPRPDFAFSLITDIEFTEMVIIAMLKSFCFSVGTISILELFKKSSVPKLFKNVSIWFYAVLDGCGWLLYVNWIDLEHKNNYASIYYFITFTCLVGSIAFLTLEVKKSLLKQAKTLSKHGKTQREIAGELGVSLTKVNKLLK